ncbi:MAG: hypothetical protein N3D73_01995 [Candidatus Diapherotrites archaeon]|nr:hypothetical protein [Candidatus Diapherotrites archaeon]
MNFIEMLFGRKNEKIRKLNLIEAEKIVYERKKEVEKELTEKAYFKISEIKHLIGTVERELEEIEKRNLLEEGENKYFRKIISSSQKNMTKQIKALLEKIKPKIFNSVEDIQSYSMFCIETIQREVIFYRKNISYTSVLLKEEVKLVGNTLQEIIEACQEIYNICSEQEYKNIKAVETMIKEYYEKNERLEKKVLELDELENKEKKLEEEINNLKVGIDKLKESDNYKKIIEIKKELEKLYEEKNEISRNFYSLLTNSEKAIKRFIVMAEKGLYIINKEEIELLKDYLEDIELASKRDPKAQKFKTILEEIKKAVEEDKINLKKEEREKRLKALQTLIEYDYFNNIFWRLNEIEKKKNLISKSLENNKILLEIEEKEECLKNKLKEYEELKKEIKIKEESISKDRLTLDYDKKLLKEKIEELIKIEIEL